ncbi:hypothetical protein [Pseudonocardia sp. HH130630-07]|uniref:hypothetical protein n=1 Tax=Pseudonocardia sp. HH130630-07 TaxID=1690815 RepID=UPI0012E9DA86|nr:hypothetical protein [Pseudonocardia sp. HH130630-07]
MTSTASTAGTTGTFPAPAPAGAAVTAGEIRAGRCTATEVVDALLERAGRTPGLVAVDAGQVRAAATALDRRTDRFALPLAGVPVAVEEGISVTGRGDEPVRRLRAAGAVVAGRARTAEFGIGPDDSPGGRATAAAVAAGLAGLGVGVDGDGALRAAAAHHGLAALKPGRRLFPLPVAAERRWAGLAETTIVAAGAADLLVALDVLAAPARRVPAATGLVPGGLDAGPPPPAAAGGPVASLACSLRTGRTRMADPAAAGAVHAAIRLLGPAGIRLLAADPPYRAVLPVHGARRRHAGLARRVADLDLDPAALPRAARSALRRGRRVRRLGGLRPATPASWRQRLVCWLDEAGAEAGLLPATAGPAGAGSTGLAAWNLAGLPSLVCPVPAGDGTTGVQLVGRPGSERRLLATAELLAGG